MHTIWRPEKFWTLSWGSDLDNRARALTPHVGPPRTVEFPAAPGQGTLETRFQPAARAGALHAELDGYCEGPGLVTRSLTATIGGSRFRPGRGNWQVQQLPPRVAAVYHSASTDLPASFSHSGPCASPSPRASSSPPRWP